MDKAAQVYAKLLYVIAACCKQQHVASNDNSFSESNFRTLKYRPNLPMQLGSAQHARQVTYMLVDWYNEEHYQVSLAHLHPVDVHYGRTADIVIARQRVLDNALARDPDRFMLGRPVRKMPPTVKRFELQRTVAVATYCTCA